MTTSDTPRTFPTTIDFAKLNQASDAEVAAIWRAICATDQLRHCCAYHAHQVEELTGSDEDWAEAVYNEMSRRNLSTEPPQQPFSCEQCGSELRCVSDPDRPMDMYAVCKQCSTMRLMGDHINCRMGPTQPLPNDW